MRATKAADRSGIGVPRETWALPPSRPSGAALTPFSASTSAQAFLSCPRSPVTTPGPSAQSKVRFIARPGTSYQIAVDGFNAFGEPTGGTVHLGLSE